MEPVRKKLTTSELKSLKSSFPHFRTLLEDPDSLLDKYYDHVAICVFDHWLKREEVGQIFTDDRSVIKERIDKLEFVARKLFEQSDMYAWKYKRHYRPYVYRISSLQSLLNHCEFKSLCAHRGEQYSFILPQFRAVYSESWDWTNDLTFVQRADIEPILELTKGAGLFELEYRKK